MNSPNICLPLWTLPSAGGGLRQNSCANEERAPGSSTVHCGASRCSSATARAATVAVLSGARGSSGGIQGLISSRK
ncbi:hypothetical protein KM539_12125 [Xanthomonas translucens pv. poae]|uniref:hypothetical protein n=1 Tax=Xanthomonas graminis TaxID=3390026 RepID=UPI00163FE5E9|nr:hypothetical protein [Xanthomonas translucens]UKE60585.1 hypothetical protein KM539_12125 [Xanthomonas translucens pv. poae]